MQSYPTRKTMARRMSRKTARLSVFLANKKAAKIRRKAERLERKAAVAEHSEN